MPTEVLVKESQKLLSKEYKHALAIRLVQQDRSRMRTADHLKRILDKFLQDGGEVRIGKNYYLRLHSELVYDAFGDDMSFTWTTDVKRFADKMPERRSSQSQLLRYQIFDAVFKITGEPIRLSEDWI